MSGAAVTTIVRGPRPAELEQWLERRRRAGADRFDEVWEGRYVVAPDAPSQHGAVQLEIALLLKSAAARLGLRPVLTFNLGGPDDYRVPDAGLLRGPHGVWHDTAVLVVEVLSPDDMALDELDFFTAHSVRELLAVDGRDRSVRCFALQEGQAERDRCEVLGMTAAELAAAVDWPPLDDAGA